MKNNSLTSKIYRKKTIEKINKKIKLLGISNEIKLNRFLSGRLIMCFIVIAVPLFLPFGVFYGPIMAVIIWYGYEYLQFDVSIKKRTQRLDAQALFFFEVLIMTLESGRNLEGALVTTADNVKSELAKEFKKSLKEIKMGKSLNEVLESISSKIPSTTINSIVINIMQANNLGTSIVDSLRLQLNSMRDQKILDTKSRLNKLPMKVSIVSVIFLIPITLIIIISPLLLPEVNSKENDVISSIEKPSKE